MKKILVLAAFTGVSVFMINCSSSKKSASTTPSTATATEMSPEATIAAVKKEYTPDQLAQGKTIFENSCNKCHGLKDPKTRTVEKLEKVLPGMIRKAKLSDDQGALVRAYMIANAKAS